jgi:tRNA nucleotidyltransferase (CCA-adding enzyme)
MAFEQYVTHGVLAIFADEKVNLKSDDVRAYRKQVSNLREKLEAHIAAHPDFDLVKMLHAGSVKKGTALSKVHDMDVAVYVEQGAAPANESDLIYWLADRLKEVYGDTKSDDDFQPQQHCVTVKFHGSGLDVDVVPVLYEGDADDKGYLITKDTGDRVLTSIPMHLAFTKKRKDLFDPDYRQTIRFAKWWKRFQSDEDFRFKSFMIELIVAHLFDTGKLRTGNFVECLSGFFGYIVRTELKERIVFTDYYPAAEIKDTGAPIQIFDPVNPENNVAFRYTDLQRRKIVDAAGEALDALSYARNATTKAEAEEVCREIFGPSFKVTT